MSLRDPDNLPDTVAPKGWIYERVTAPRPTWREAGKRRTLALPQKMTNADGRIRDGYRNMRQNSAGRWQVQFIHHGQRHYVPGAYDTEFEAAEAYDEYIEAHGLHRDGREFYLRKNEREES